MININKLLRVSVDQRKPAALYLNHNAMTFFKIMRHRR